MIFPARWFLHMNCNLPQKYVIPIPTLNWKFVWLSFKQLVCVAGSIIFGIQTWLPYKEYYTDSYVQTQICMDDVEITLALIRNARGEVMKTMTTRFRRSDMEELDSYDMIASINTVSHEEEEGSLNEYENGHWQCCKCNHSNQNNSGYCTNMMQGECCGGTPISKKKSWAGCFGVCDSHFFFIGLISAKILTQCKLNPPKLTQTWKCQNCTLVNEMDKKNCAACM